MKPIDWDIRREGRIWSHEESNQRTSQAPEKRVSGTCPDPRVTTLGWSEWVTDPRRARPDGGLRCQ